MTAAAAERCGARVFTGTEYHRCSRPASVVRDGLLTCGQHAELERIAWAGQRPETLSGPPAPISPALAEWRRIVRGEAGDGRLT